MIEGAFQVLGDDSGAAIIEYAIITAGISIAAIATLQAMGVSIDGLYASTVANWADWANSGQ